MIQGKRYLIVGDGAAGVTAARLLRERDPLAAIACISDDPQPAYYRAALTNYLLGELREEHIWAVPPTFFMEYRIERLLGRAVGVDAAKKQLWMEGVPQPLPYDALLIAAGSRARPGPFEGANAGGVLTLRTLRDARWTLDLVEGHGIKRAVILGGGPLAIEWASALREREVDVHLLVRGDRILLGAIDQVGSDLVLTRMRQQGIQVVVNEEVAAATAGKDGWVVSVRGKTGRVYPCGLVGVAIGVIPNSELVAQAGVKLAKGGAIVVDERMRTNVSGIWAAGDVAETPAGLLQLWEPAQRQAQVAAIDITGGQARYQPGAHYMATRLHDLDFASIGKTARSDADEELVFHPRGSGSISYRKLLLKGGKLVGAVMLGQRSERVRAHGRNYKRLIDERVDVSSIKDQLLDARFDLKGWLKRAGLLEKPSATAAPSSSAPAVPEPAKIRGTQFIDLSAAMPGPGQPAPPPRPAAPAAAPEGKPLTIGLRAAQGPAQSAGLKGHLDGGGQRWPIDKAVVSLGRAPQNQVVLGDSSVSQVHAQITLYQGELYLRDLGSRNGTFVNGQKVVIPHRLRGGDRLKMGTTELTFAGP